MATMMEAIIVRMTKIIYLLTKVKQKMKDLLTKMKQKMKDLLTTVKQKMMKAMCPQ